MIEVRNVSKSFNGTVDAVKSVSLTINDGEIFGIVGYSGAGKSTLVRLMNQLEKQDSGDIIVDGVAVNRLNVRELNQKRQKMGMIFQNFNLLWSRTVKENVMFPLEIAKKKDEKRVLELIELVGLSDKMDSYPSELSGGQKQRVGIARALANNPSILLCDEATSALDPKTTIDILELLKKINEETGITIVIITHQMEVIQKICERVIVMANGEIIEEGKVEEIFKNPKHDLTRQLIQNVESDIDTDELKVKYKGKHLVKLTFGSDTADEPILSNLAQKTNIVFSIVAANMKDMINGSHGVMYVVVENNIKEFIRFLTEKKVEVELYE